MKKLGSFLSGAALLGYTAFTMLVVLLLLFAEQLYYVNKKTFLLPNGVLLALGVAVAIVCTVACLRSQAKCEVFLAKHSCWMMCLLCVAFLLVLFYFTNNAFFVVGWDAGLVNYTAQMMADGMNPMPDFVNVYYARYPNNLMLTWVYGQLLKVDWLVNLFPEHKIYMVLIWYQAVLSVIVSVSLYHLILDATKKYLAAWFTWLAYVLLIGTSFWVLVPYSDATGIVFPILILRLYQLIKRTDKKWLAGLFWAVLMALTYVGYYIKPTVAIVTMAILIAEAVTYLQCHASTPKEQRRNAWCNGAIATVCMAVAFVGCNVFYHQVVIPDSGIILAPEAEIGVSHFFMMGLNADTNGVCDPDDQDFSVSFETKKERTKANLQEAFVRIEEFGVDGLLLHYAKKLRMNFGDATFAWGKEGTFYMVEYEPLNNFISPILTNLRNKDNASYQYIATFYQFIWVFAVVASVGLGLLYRSESMQNRRLILALAIALLGMLLYSVLFEARARYLYLYTPLYLTAAAFGWYGLVRTVRQSKWLARLFVKSV